MFPPVKLVDICLYRQLYCWASNYDCDTYCHLIVLLCDTYCILSTIDIVGGSFDTLGFRHSQTMLFAIDEINRSDSLLPNVTLGYRLHDNCASLGVAFRAAFSLASGKEERFDQALSCSGTPVVGIVGDSISTNTIAISSVLGLYKMPMVSLHPSSNHITFFAFNNNINKYLFVFYLWRAHIMYALYVFVGELLCHFSMIPV